MKKTLAIALVAGIGATAAAQPANFIDLGKIGNEGDYTFDTFGSNYDTEMGIWNSAGTLLANNDDFGGLQSSIALTYTAGQYYIGIGRFNNTFDNGFVLTGVGSFDDTLLNLNGVNLGTWNGNGEPLWYRFDVSVPAPGSMALLGLGGLAAVRRRRA